MDTLSQVADIFTKRLGTNIIEKALEKINLVRSKSQPREGVLEYLGDTVVTGGMVGCEMDI